MITFIELKFLPREYWPSYGSQVQEESLKYLEISLLRVKLKVKEKLERLSKRY